jgi:hypothetical protein
MSTKKKYRVAVRPHSKEQKLVDDVMNPRDWFRFLASLAFKREPEPQPEQTWVVPPRTLIVPPTHEIIIDLGPNVEVGVLSRFIEQAKRAYPDRTVVVMGAVVTLRPPTDRGDQP